MTRKTIGPTHPNERNLLYILVASGLGFMLWDGTSNAGVRVVDKKSPTTDSQNTPSYTIELADGVDVVELRPDPETLEYIPGLVWENVLLYLRRTIVGRLEITDEQLRESVKAFNPRKYAKLEAERLATYPPLVDLFSQYFTAMNEQYSNMK